MFKVIVAGSRSFNDYEHLEKTLDTLLQNKKFVEILSGGADGADKLGEQYAKTHGHILTVVPAQWSKHGKSAGPIRNKRMASMAEALVAFWDGESKGTKSMLEEARKAGLEIREVRV
jgi:hypothetical protein